MNHCSDFAPCGPSIEQYNSYSYSYIILESNQECVKCLLCVYVHFLYVHLYMYI